MHGRCGVRVSLKIFAEKKDPLFYESHPETFRTMEVQVGKAERPKRQKSNPSQSETQLNTLKKIRFHNLPAKKKSPPVKAPIKNVSNKCKECKIKKRCRFSKSQRDGENILDRV